jgi:hypothetical protein
MTGRVQLKDVACVYDPVAKLRTLTQPLPKGEEKIAPGSDYHVSRDKRNRIRL